MNFKRLFSTDKFKGERNYLSIQRIYEIIRTVLLFALSAAVYLIGFLTTHTNKNLLTIVAVLGVLPAAKSAVNMIMFIRFKSCDKAFSEKVSKLIGSSSESAFDLVFTSYEKNYQVAHLVVKSGSVICYTEKAELNEENFSMPIGTYLKVENYKDITIKVFKDKDKYLERLKALSELKNSGNEEGIMNVLKSISL